MESLLIIGNELVTEGYLLNKGFESKYKHGGAEYFRKGYFEVVKLPTTKNRFTFAFEFVCKFNKQHKRPLLINDLESLYKILIGKEL